MLHRILCLLSLLLLTGCSTLIIENHPVHPKAKDTLRIGTYNLFCEDGNHMNPHKIVDIIREIKADIMVFQECQCMSRSFFRRQLGRLYPYQIFIHYKDGIKEHEDGLGIISRYPIVQNILYPPVYGWSPGWLLVIKTPDGCIQVFNAHLNPRLARDHSIGLFAEGLWWTPKFRLNEINYYYHLLYPNLPAIFAGDFNENDDDNVVNYLRKRKFFDALTCVPSYIKTWHWDLGCFSLTGRYDHILSSNCFRYLCSHVVQKGQSDHFPVFVDLKQR